MTLRRLIWRSLRYYHRTALAVTLGLVVATAVVTGSLVIGDSITGSLRKTALGRLGSIEQAISSPRPFEAALASRLAARRGQAVTPVLMVSGTATSPDTGAVVPQVRVWGVEGAFWSLYADQPQLPLEGRQSAINAALAHDLGLQPGDGVLITWQPPTALAAESLFAHRGSQATAPVVRLEVTQVLPAGPGVGDFRPDPQPAVPRNLFVSRQWLSQLLDLTDAANLMLTASRLTPATATDRPSAHRPHDLNRDQSSDLTHDPARNLTNDITRDPEHDPVSDSPHASKPDPVYEPKHNQTHELAHDLARVASLASYGLRLQPNPVPGHLVLTGEQMVLPEHVLAAAREAAARWGAVSSQASVYLATRLRTSRGESAYAMVAAVEPLQQWEIIAGSSAYPTGDEIWLNSWAAADLQAHPGDSLQLETLVAQPDGRYESMTLNLRVSGLVALQGPAADAALIPLVRGLTDQATIDSWQAPFPVDLSRITPRDEAYWAQYRATPRAFVSQATLRRLWRQAPGAAANDWVTSVRLQPPADQTLAAFAPACEAALLQALRPAAAGLVVQPVRQQALIAAQGTSDFGQLFMGLSFFLVLSGLGLAAVLLQLALERRSAEAGLLLACGWSVRQVQRVQSGEMVVMAATGAVVGAAAGVGYAALIIRALGRWWGGALGEAPLLELEVSAVSLLTGGLSGLLVGAVASWASFRHTRWRQPLQLLAGWQSLSLQLRAGRGAGWLASGCLLAAAILLTGTYSGLLIAPTEAFFGVGLLLLVAGLAGARAVMAVSLQQPKPVQSRARLAWRNVAAGGKRSVLVMGLLASATFIVVAVAANTRDLSRLDPTDRTSGTGGFNLRVDTSVPLPCDPTTPTGRQNLGLTAADEALLTGCTLISLRASPGEDISCLNIARPRHPRLLGVPAALIKRGGFTLQTTGSQRAGWERLEQPEPDGTLPAFGDADSVRWSLHAKLGQAYELEGVAPAATLRLAGLVQGSIFARELLVSQASLRQLYPTIDRPSVLLIETPPRRETAVAEMLRRQLGPLGAEVRLTREILNDFMRVQNTYLSMFMALGALGIMLGTVGLVLVMQRSALERRGEWALLLATGWTPARLGRLLLAEFASLLLAGLLLGAACALVAVGPQLRAATAAVNWSALIGVGGIIALTGMVAAWRVAWQISRSDLIQSLRAQ